MAVIHERLLEPRPELALTFQNHIHQGSVLLGLVERRELPGAEFGIRVRDNDVAIFAVDEADALVGVFGFDGDDELGGEAEVLHDVEGVDGEVGHAVVGDLRLVHCVEVEGERGREEDEEEEAAIAAPYAAEAAGGARLLVARGVVLGDVAAVRRGPEVSLVLGEHGVVSFVAGFHG